MAKNKLVKALIVVVLVLLVPFLIGRTTVAILNITYPPAAPAAGRDRSEAQAAMRSLERARAITRIALVIIGVYYVVLISVWVILRRQQRKALRS